jgi:CheY-like chemotaxis protein/anti-sigma regulatory factor (Ser/Thr protein kinase)
MSNILVVDDDHALHESIGATLASQGHLLLHARDGAQGMARLAQERVDLVLTDFDMPGMDGVDFLKQLRRDHPDLKCIMMTAPQTPEAVVGALREHVCDFLSKPFTQEELTEAVSATLAACPSAEIEVVSARPEWIELKVPCDLGAVAPLEKALAELGAGLTEEARDAITLAFREMLNNAIEHGGELDPTKRVEVTYVRLERAVICWIEDPGKGFDVKQQEHAAVNNPGDDPLRHALVREEQGLRAGGFGILLTKQMVDEMLYNERGNKLVFVKYVG